MLTRVMERTVTTLRAGRDPGFANAARGDFTLRPDSPARAHGATALPDRR